MLDSWAAVRGVEDVTFVFSLEPMNGVTENLKYINDFFLETHCRVEIKLNNEIQGPAKNHFVALQAAADFGSKFMIQGEEDIIVSSDILEYMNYGWGYVSGSNDTPLVCGYSTKDSGKLADVRKVDGFPNCWMWGTNHWWWKHYIGPNWDSDFSTGEGNERGWDWALARLLEARGWHSLQPDVSRAQNIGELGWSTGIGSVVEVPTFEPLQPPANYNLI